MTPLSRCLLAAGLTASTLSAHAQVQITEWMYSGASGEYVELTNLGASAVDFTGWSFDDSSRTAGTTDLSAFGSVAAGASVILTEATAADFRAAWALAPTIQVIGGNTNNLGRSDEINLYDASAALVDRLTYGDVAFPGTVRTQNASGTPSALADLVPQSVTAGWVLASMGDAYGSTASTGGDIGNPGAFTLAVPEPSTYALLLGGLALVAGAARRRSA
ncbi:MAG: PEP-CTERM sorting domain-containing protein [Burkholderiales bacterium RIFCSPHIGHO2_12_FULL_69_20]|nr:MAG: PEP-CTERM sorting domain-containing protein [Burkholderiales bacterium RIFCSPHIGHO2_12_FULL_69_20]